MQQVPDAVAITVDGNAARVYPASETENDADLVSA